MFLTGFALLNYKLLGGFKILEVKLHTIFKIRNEFKQCFKLCFLHFMALLCAGTKGITSPRAFHKPSQEAVPPKSCSVHSSEPWPVLGWDGGWKLGQLEASLLPALHSLGCSSGEEGCARCTS